MNQSFGPRNYALIALGALVGACGLYLLSLAPVNNPVSLNVAPFVLLFGYLVLIPAGFLIPGPAVKAIKEMVPPQDSKSTPGQKA